MRAVSSLHQIYEHMEWYGFNSKSSSPLWIVTVLGSATVIIITVLLSFDQDAQVVWHVWTLLSIVLMIVGFAPPVLKMILNPQKNVVYFDTRPMMIVSVLFLLVALFAVFGAIHLCQNSGAVVCPFHSVWHAAIATCATVIMASVVDKHYQYELPLRGKKVKM